MVTAGVVTAGVKGRRENIEKPIAGLRACGAAMRFDVGMVAFRRTIRVQN